MLHVLLAQADDRAKEWFPEDQILVVQDLARRKFPLTRLLAGIRAAHASVSNAYLEACAEFAQPAERVGELQRVSAVMMEIFDGLTEQTEIEYRKERKKWFHNAVEVRRSELVQDVLEKPLIDIESVEQELMYPLKSRQHLGVVAWHQRGPDGLAQLDSAVQDWLARAGARYTLTVNCGVSSIWGWGSMGLDELTREFSGSGLDLSDTCIAFGTWAMGVQGFRTTHHEAVAAEDVANTFPRVCTSAINYRDISLLSLAVSDPERALHFAVSELGALAEASQRNEELRSTVKEYLELRSPKAVAAKQFLARGTVSYRLRQAEELLGYSLESRATELRLAIELFESQVRTADYVRH
jgi:hypothetical protein